MSTIIPTKQKMYEALKDRHGEILQEKFAAASVAVCGLGGLGSNIAISLARAGVGRLHLIDFDNVDISNLNRQQYVTGQIGMPKTKALQRILRVIAPYTDITADTVRITGENAEELLKNDNIICEAFDEAEEKAMLVNFVLEHMPDKYLVAGSGMAGISSANTIRTKRIAEKFYLCGDGTSEITESEGLFASRVMVCAAHQAHMILRIIAGEYEA